jgi:hypothetical protein
MLYKSEKMMNERALQGLSLAEVTTPAEDEDFETAEQMVQSAQARLTKLKEMYRQQLGLV